MRFLGWLLGTAATAALAMQACADSVETEDDANSTGSADGGGGGGASSASSGGGPGAGGDGGAFVCPGASGITLAVDQLFLGDTDFAGSANPNAWRQFGFDVDGITTTSDFSNHCLPNDGGTPADEFPDGDAGIDNSWGKNVLPALSQQVPDIATQANTAIDGGNFTLMALLADLAGTSQSPVPSKLYGGAALGSTPTWDGNDCWPVTPESLADESDIEATTITFDAASVTDDVWESNGTATLVLPLQLNGVTVPITIYQARLQMELNPSHTGAGFGQIGGVLDTEELVEIVRDVAGTIDITLCNGVFLDELLQDIRQASDILIDGTQDSSQTCNAISVGIGFTMTEVQRGAIGPESQLPPNPCL